MRSTSFDSTSTTWRGTVSLASLTNSASNPAETTVVLNFNFNPGPDGTYTVLTQINYGSGYAGPWQGLGTLIIDPARVPIASPPVYQPPPTSADPITPPPPVTASATDCGDISGTWSGSGGSTYSFDTSAGALNSDSSWTYCGTVTPITGSLQPDGTWQVTITNEVYACGAYFPPITASVSPGCTHRGLR